MGDSPRVLARNAHAVQAVDLIEGKPAISKADLESIFEYGGVHGYAGERGDGEGRYFATVQEVK